MKKTLTIAEGFAEARATWNPLYLIKAVYLIILQRRFIEAIYGVYCYIRLSPSVVSAHSHWNSLADLDENLKQLLFSVKNKLSREEIVHIFGQDYAAHFLPRDFAGARIEGIMFSGALLIVGEYGNPGKRIAIVSQQSCMINEYYETNCSVKHIHSICGASDAGLILVTTGDTAKYLDLWALSDGDIRLVKRVKKLLAGYTAMLRMSDECFLGTDFSSRPNYLMVFENDIKKFAFPIESYCMYVSRLVPYMNRYIACLSKDLKCFGNRHALSVFDIEQKEFVFCDYVQYDEPETANKALHRTAITLRSIAAGELRR
jgi:hypothetical protein